MITDISERFATQCAVVVENSYDTCGTITRASVSNLTPDQLEAMFVTDGLFADLDAFFHTALEMKACGTEVNGMYEWIMSGADRERFRGAISGSKVVGSGNLVQPWIMAKQKSIFNNPYWVVVGGNFNDDYTGATPEEAIGTTGGSPTAGPLTVAEKALGAASDRILRLISRYGVELDDKYFKPRTVLHLYSREAGAGVTQLGNWRVLAAEVNSTGTYIDVLVTSENAGSAMPWENEPVTGIVSIGVNNVDDYESWCYNHPNHNTEKRVPFWFQTIRRTRCIDQFYKEFLKRMMEGDVNRAFREFGDVSLIERNRQDEEAHQRALVNAFFFQKPYNVNQTLDAYQSLPQITTPSGYAIDPGTGGKLIAYRANFIGVKEQLYRCDRVRDLQGEPLNFLEWLRMNYQIMRARQTRKGDAAAKSIDWYTSSSYAARLQTAFMKYWKERSLEQFRITWDVSNQKDNSNVLGFNWWSFRVQWPAGLQINIVWHNYFDDWLAANTNEDQTAAGNFLLALDIGKPGVMGKGGSIYLAHLKSNRVTHTRGELSDLARIDSDWSCVMKANTVEQTLQSDTVTVIVECPQDNLWIEGIADEDPVTTGEVYPYGDLV